LEGADNCGVVESGHERGIVGCFVGFDGRKFFWATWLGNVVA
jgi:hypothetical protein